MIGSVVVFFIATAMGSSAQTFSTLATFDGTNGGLPVWALVQGTNGNFYGSTGFGGTGSEGTIFKITPAGKLTTLQSMGYPHLPVQATNGSFYGTTPYGGPMDSGTVFKMTAAGKLTTLYNFCSQAMCVDGDTPYGGVIQASDGNFYGTTVGGGTNNYGTVFKITPAGKLTTLLSFDAIGGAGTGLVEGTDGNFYGTTGNGGPNGYGTVFQVTPGGTETTLYNFCSQPNCTDGKSPYDGLIQASDGNFYGTTYTGGANDPAGCEGIGCGTIFKITPAGTLTTLYSFCSQANCTDGQWPTGGLVQGNDGNFYGTTDAGGAFGESCVFGLCGTVFKMTPEGVLTTLHSFAGSDGSSPYSGLVQGTNGTFYGTTEMGADLSCGGGYGCGTVFSLSVGLSPFVETRPTSGKVRAKVIVLGNNLTGATGVSFNGTAATFKVVSKTEITTVVPAGATTGTVTVTTPKGTLDSNVAFQVTP
ncbi:MAG: choice-of-anchor tandem repeat GloVer-containing protein [Terriglobia bacterium]